MADMAVILAAPDKPQLQQADIYPTGPGLVTHEPWTGQSQTVGSSQAVREIAFTALALSVIRMSHRQRKCADDQRSIELKSMRQGEGNDAIVSWLVRYVSSSSRNSDTTSFICCSSIFGRRMPELTHKGSGTIVRSGAGNPSEGTGRLLLLVRVVWHP